jgi:hypothetical protein
MYKKKEEIKYTQEEKENYRNQSLVCKRKKRRSCAKLFH